jgi:hypothetical protein
MATGKRQSVSRSDPSERSEDLKLRFGKGLVPKGDVVFASIDAAGNSGELNQYVLKRLKDDPSQLPSAEGLSEGFALRERLEFLVQEGKPAQPRYIAFVVTVAPDDKPGELLLDNLTKALVAVSEITDVRSIWLPLMGTGEGKLSLLQSLSLTFAAILLARPDLPTNITIAAPANVKPDQYAKLRQAFKTLQSKVPPAEDAGEATSAAAPYEDDAATQIDAAASEPKLRFPLIAEKIVALVDEVTQPGEAPPPAADRRTGIIASLRIFWQGTRTLLIARLDRIPWLRPLAARLTGGQGRKGPESAFGSREKSGQQGAADARLTIGIFAPWGAGKSTLIKALQTAFRGANYFTITVNPWKWNGQGDIHDHVREVAIRQAQAQHIGSTTYLLRANIFLRENGRWLWWLSFAVVVFMILYIFGLLPVIGEFVGTAFSPANGEGASGSWWQGFVALVVPAAGWLWKILGDRLGGRLSAWIFGPQPHLVGAEGLASAYQDIAALVARSNKDSRPFVFFIDDLDRCTPERVASVLDSIHSLTMAGCVVFIACDDRYVSAALSAQYKDISSRYGEEVDFGRQFLEKIVQVAFHIPTMRDRDIAELGLAEAPNAQPEGDTPVRPAPGDAAPDEDEGEDSAGVVSMTIPTPDLPAVRLRAIIGELLEKAVGPLGLNIRRVKSLSNTMKLYLDISGCKSERDARRHAAFIFANQIDPDWLDGHFHGIHLSDTRIARVPDLPERLAGMIGDDRSYLLYLYGLVGRQPRSLAELQPPTNGNDSP